MKRQKVVYVPKSKILWVHALIFEDCIANIICREFYWLLESN